MCARRSWPRVRFLQPLLLCASQGTNAFLIHPVVGLRPCSGRSVLHLSSSDPVQQAINCDAATQEAAEFSTLKASWVAPLEDDRQVEESRLVLPNDWNGTTFDANLTSPVNALTHRKPKSQIREIRSCYLAGVVNNASSVDRSHDTIIIPFQDHHNLVAVTGETASGKSLLVARVIELITGSKAATTFLAPGYSTATAEIELFLTDPYLAAAELLFEKLDLDSSSLIPTVDNEINRSGTLVLSRILQLQSANASNVSSTGNGKPRIKSICSVNGQGVTLKVLGNIASPLLAVVDTPMASFALSKGSARTGILDTAVPPQYVSQVADARKRYRECRRHREKVEEDVASRILPGAFALRPGNDADLELLSHWIDELDAFAMRVETFCRLASSRISMGNDDHDTSNLSEIARRLQTISWSDNEVIGSSFILSIYTVLSELRDALQALDDQIEISQNAVDALGALSSTTSAATAVERARKLLLSVSTSEGSKLSKAFERSHELINDLEATLNKCTKFLRDDDLGVLSTLEASRLEWGVSVESIDTVLLDWKSLARKHGILPTALPSCHLALISERDGNDEASAMLPIALAAEEEALVVLKEACAVLSVERRRAAGYLADAVSERMPSLGMGDSVFRVNMTTDDVIACEGVGIETADFLLLRSSDSSRRGALVNEVASSGEKARILLAIECAMPGSIGAACSNAAVEEDLWDGLPPIAVVYDEIDAHVGGRAAVSMANLLVDQSKSGQVIAITHSPSVAAAADMHVVIQKEANHREAGVGSINFVSARVVGERDRRLELARMASGDLAAIEAEAFAEALLRDGMERRRTR